MSIIKALFAVLVMLQFCVAQKAADTTVSPKKVSTIQNSASVDKKAGGVQKSAKNVMELSISADGKSIVDQQGNVIADFKQGICIKPSADKSIVKLPGCMCWSWDCVRMQNGKCLEKVKTYQWSFDCSCGK